MKPNKLACALAGLLLAPTATILAQTAPPSSDTTQNPAPAQPAKQLQTITVTGSAIPRVDLETPSPVTVITAVQIERSGLKTVSDVIRAVSADNSGSIPNAFTAGFAAGSAGVALRGLTVNSTLVLIDGQRSANYALADDGQRSFVDLNTIPVNAIERIEVLKDGASSLYGADAIAGVVNVILKRSYKGGEATAEVGTSQHGGGFTRRFTGIFGGGDLDKDGHNAYLSVEYQKDNAIMNRDRSFPFNTLDLRSIGGINGNGGQPSAPSGSIVKWSRPTWIITPPSRGCVVQSDPHSAILPACHAAPLPAPRSSGTAASTAVSVVRPPSTMSAPASRAAMYGSGPISATMWSQARKRCGSLSARGGSGAMRPCCALATISSGACSE